MNIVLKSRRSFGRVTALAVASLLVLAGCGTSTEPDAAPAVEDALPMSESEAVEDSYAAEEQTEDEGEEEEQVAEPTTRVQEETCDWDSPKLVASAQMPTGQEGDLSEVIVGSWQHTHFDSGGGFEETTNDHRYVFPSADRVLYCQDVPGVTDQAENAADITWDGTAIQLPGGTVTYTVTAWSDDAIAWTNSVDGSTYLLQRR